MNNPKYDSYREYHEQLTWRDLEMTFDKEEEDGVDAFERWARFEEDENDVCLR